MKPGWSCALGKVKRIVAHFRRPNNKTYALQAKQNIRAWAYTRICYLFEFFIRHLREFWNSSKHCTVYVLMENKEKHVRTWMLISRGNWTSYKAFMDTTKEQTHSKYATISLHTPTLIYITLKDSIILKFVNMQSALISKVNMHLWKFKDYQSSKIQD